MLDGHRQSTPPGAFSLHLDTRGLASGSHRVQVLATDIDGQATLTPASKLKIDGGSPIVRIARTREATP